MKAGTRLACRRHRFCTDVLAVCTMAQQNALCAAGAAITPRAAHSASMRDEVNVQMQLAFIGH
jgi:hypothetical protein